MLSVPFVQMHSQNANSIIESSINEIGGTAWKNIEAIQMHHIGHKHWLEQSEKPEGPFITSYEDVLEVRSLKNKKLYRKIEMKYIQSAKPIQSEIGLIDQDGWQKYGTRYSTLQQSEIDEASNWLLYGPEQLLFLAVKENVILGNDVVLDGVTHYQINFQSEGKDISLFINKNTRLLSEAEIKTQFDYDFYFSLWGYFSTRIKYSIYSLNKSNIIYPLQWDIYRTGQKWKSITINEIEFLQQIDSSIFTAPSDVSLKITPKMKVSELKLQIDKIVSPSENIQIVPGSWNTSWIEQDDGLFVLEAPIHSAFTQQLITFLKEKYPSKEIKGVLVSSDAWPHLAGVRSYFTLRVPVYTHELNLALLKKVAHVPYKNGQNVFQEIKTKLVFRPISTLVTIEDKREPIQLVPVNGEAGERMIMVYFPKSKLLYASDLIQKYGDKFFFPEYLREVYLAVKENNLIVNKVFAMHLLPIDWTEVIKALESMEGND